MPFVQRQATHGAEQFVALAPAQSTHGDGRVRKAIARGAYGVGRTARHFTHVRQGVHVRGLALVGRHAERGVALQVLHRAEIFLRGKLDIGGRHVMHEVDECLAAPTHSPQRCHGRIDSRGVTDGMHGLHGSARAELCMGCIPLELAAGLREQVNRG